MEIDERSAVGVPGTASFWRQTRVFNVKATAFGTLTRNHAGVAFRNPRTRRDVPTSLAAFVI